jgi:hypothetical protein
VLRWSPPIHPRMEVPIRSGRATQFCDGETYSDDPAYNKLMSLAALSPTNSRATRGAPMYK